MKMKEVFLIAALLFGSSFSKLQSAKRTVTCSNFPRQLSGRVFMTEDENTFDVRFHLDTERQFLQADIKLKEKGVTYSMYLDHKNKKYFLVHPGGCLAGDPSEGFPIIPTDVSQFLKPVTSGRLGMNGASVNVYSVKTDEGSGMVTLQDGDACIPVNFAFSEKDSDSNFHSAYGSYLDLRTAADPEKLKIPEKCMEGRRSIPARLVRLKGAVKKGFAWINAKKRGFPWIVGADEGVHKRGFPWVIG